MKQDENKSKKEIFSIEDIISIFTSIDQNLTSLHDCSSEDFLNIQVFLKNYHQQAEIISKHASEIFELASNRESRNQFEKLKDLQNEFVYNIRVLENDLNELSSSLEKIMINQNLLFVPLKNFNQNLMTLGFLLTNYKLNLTYIDKRHTSNLVSDENSIKLLIEEIKNIVAEIEEENASVKYLLSTAIIKLSDLKEKNTFDIENIVENTLSSVYLLALKNEEGKEKIKELSVKTKDYFVSIDKIITNLQYHDIIRQRMEHVQDAHKDIINELRPLISVPDSNEGLNLTHDDINKIKEIAGIQAAQLLHTNKEYQNAIEIIINQFLEIGEKISGISNLCIEFTGQNQNIELNYFLEIESNLKEVIKVLKKIMLSNKKLSLEIETFKLTLEKLSPTIESLITSCNYTIDTATITLEKSKDIVEKDEDLQYIKIQIEELISQIQTNLSSIKSGFNLSKSLFNNIKENIDIFREDNQIDFKLNKLVNEFSKIVSEIRINNTKINGLINEKIIAGADLSNQVKKAIDKIKYYDFFEKIITEILVQLNKLQNKVEQLNPEIQPTIGKRNLENLEKRYTMETERLIHEKVINNNKDELNRFQKDDEVEFF